MKKTASGQALLIILLVMMVGLTMGLSLATRSVADVKFSGQLEDSSRAFAAAEAGIEEFLINVGVGGTGTVGNAKYQVTTSIAGNSDQAFSLGEIAIGDTYTIWLLGHNASGGLDWATTYSGSSLDICWGKTSGSREPAVETSILYKDSSNQYIVWRGAFDPDAVGRSQNYFAAIDSGGCESLTNKKTLNFSNLGISGTKIALRLRFFYAPALVSIVPTAGNNLPTQGLQITSTGTSGETTRKMVITQSYASLPSIFDYVLFSGKNIEK